MSVKTIETAEDYVRWQADFATSRGHTSLSAWLLERGQAYEWKPKPDDLEYGRAKECYANATHAALAYPDRYIYCEGFGATSGGIPCEHAWLIDREDGKAVDLTWRHMDDTCPFCDEGMVEVAYEWDEDGEETGWNEEPCDWCHATGKDPHGGNRDRSGTTYFGIELEIDEFRRLLVKSRVYGVLPTLIREDL